MTLSNIEMAAAQRFDVVLDEFIQDLNIPVMAFNCLKTAVSVGLLYMTNTVSAMPAVYTVLVSIYTGTMGTLWSLGAGSLSGLTWLSTSAGTFGTGVVTNIVTPLVGFIKPYVAKVVIDEASKAFKPVNATEFKHTTDAETEKAQREVNKQIANLAEEKVPGTGNYMQLFLKNFSIREIWNCIRDFLFCIIPFLCKMLCCNICKFKKQKAIIPPKEKGNDNINVIAVKKEGVNRVRNKSPGPPRRKSKSEFYIIE